MLKIDGGLLSCWWQTARRRGSIHKEKKLCNPKENEKRKMTEERWKKCINKG